MDTGKTALIFFFGMFWASALGAITEYRAFDTAAWFRSRGRGSAIRRFCAAVCIANIAPLFLLWFLYASDRIVPSGESTAVVLAVAAVASLSVFAIPRFLHAFIATRPLYGYFYDEAVWQEVVEDSKAELEDSFIAHFLSGLIYLVGFPVLAVLIWGVFGG